MTAGQGLRVALALPPILRLALCLFAVLFFIYGLPNACFCGGVDLEVFVQARIDELAAGRPPRGPG